MALTAGTRLGLYEILAPIGAGGMGEVYRAKDTKLDREVAIKVLPGAFAQDPERLARFEREAKVLAALNHPNIAQIYGFEQSDGIRALAMELVPGGPPKGPLPLETALNYARQIADALEAAHEKGVTHDGNRIAFSSNRAGQFDLYQNASNGAGQDQLLFKSDHVKFVEDWSRDGHFLLYYDVDPKTKSDLWVLPMDGASSGEKPGGRK